MPNNSNDTLLEINNLSVELEQSGSKSIIIEDINISINKKQRVALIGQSGSGKTVTARSVLGILPENMNVSSGQFIYNNKIIPFDDETALEELRGNKIAMIFQEPHAALNPVFKVGSQLTDVIQTNLKISKRQSKDKALDVLSDVGFADGNQIFKMYPDQLSGGMAQRVLIAMALGCKPELIIADEPTSALDAVTRTKVLNLVFDLQEKYQFAFLIISHDIPLIKKYVDDVYILKDGKLLYHGMIKDIAYPNPDPYIQSLFETLSTVM